MRKYEVPVFSGMEAWSVFLSFLNTMLPNCKTADTTLSIAALTEKQGQDSQQYVWVVDTKYFWKVDVLRCNKLRLNLKQFQPAFCWFLYTYY